MTGCMCQYVQSWEDVGKCKIAKNEGASTPGIGKSAATFKSISSSRFLPKGTKAKVNLEEQGRQKVSFSFSFTKKTLQNRLLTALTVEKQNDVQNAAGGLSEQNKPKTEGAEPSVNAFEISPPKPKVELGKIHFKKHHLGVTSKLPAPPPPPPPPAAIPVAVPMSPILSTQGAPPDHSKFSPLSEVVSPATILAVESPEKAPSSTLSSLSLTSTKDNREDSAVSVAESLSTQVVDEKAEPIPSKDYSHIGKGEKISVSVQIVKPNPSPEKPSSKLKPPHSETAVVGSESDGDSVQTSSSHRSHEVKKAASKERDPKRTSVSLRRDDGGKYSSSRTKSVKEEKDEKHSSYSRSDRDSKYSSYSRSKSDRDRKRSRSRSRSRSISRSDRGPRGSSSYSRSERSHYYEPDRRYHRSSPYRTRYSRSYADSRARDSSDSEDDYRRTHSRSSDPRRPSSSSHSSSYRDSRTSSSAHSKYDKDPKLDSSYDSDRKGRPSSRTEKDIKSSDRESSKKVSPQREVDMKSASSHSKAESSASSAKSNSSKASDAKQEHAGSGGKISKWDLEKRPEEKEGHSLVRRDKDQSTSKDGSEYRKSDLQDSPPARSRDSDRSRTAETGSASGWESKWRGFSTAPLFEGQRKSPILVNDSYSPEHTWEFVTLSSTDDVPADEQSDVSQSESSSGDVTSNTELEKTPVAHSEGEQCSVVEPGDGTPHLNGLGHDHGSSSVFSDPDYKPVSVSRSKSWRVLDVSINEPVPCHPSDKIDIFFDHKLLNYESVQEDDNHAFIDSEAKPTVTVLAPESLNVSRTMSTDEDFDSVQEISNVCTSGSSDEQNNTCGVPPTEPSAPETPESDYYVIKEETAVTSNVMIESPSHSQVSTSLPNFEKDNVDTTWKNTEGEEDTPVVPPEAPTEQIEVLKANYESDEEEDGFENYKVQSVHSSDEEKNEIAADSSRPAVNFISAVRAYYSDTEESASEESESDDTDSDDSGLPRNRLQSVVVVPKTSTISMEEDNLESLSPSHQERTEQSYDRNEIGLPEGHTPEQMEHRVVDQIDSNSNMSIEEEPTCAPEPSSFQDAEMTVIPDEVSEQRLFISVKDLEQSAPQVNVSTPTTQFVAPVKMPEEVTNPAQSLEPFQVPVPAPQAAPIHIQASESASAPVQRTEPSYVPTLQVDVISVNVTEPDPIHVQESQSEVVSLQVPETAIVPVMSTELGPRNTVEEIPIAAQAPQLTPMADQAPQLTPMPDQTPQLTPAPDQTPQFAPFPVPASQPFAVPFEAPQPYPSPVEVLQPYPVSFDVQQLCSAPREAPPRETFSIQVQHLDSVSVQAPQPCLTAFPGQVQQLGAFTFQAPQHGAFPVHVPPPPSPVPVPILPCPIPVHSPQPCLAPVQSSQLGVVAVHAQQPDIPQPPNDADVSTSHFVSSEQCNNGEMSTRCKEVNILGQTKSATHQPAASVPSKPSKFESKSLYTPAEKPDSRQPSAYSHGTGAGDFSRADGFQAAEDLSDLGWDFSQPEKPSSTYQPADSSYMYCRYQQGSGVCEPSHNYGENNRYWDPGCHNQGPTYNYVKTGVPVPDSLTHCYNEDDDDVDEEDIGWEDDQGHHQVNKLYYDRSKESGSVQAHEISSNSAKENLPRNEKKDHLGRDRSEMKERGPPKKRRQELECDSENDAEALERRRLKAEAGLLESAGPKPVKPGSICPMEEFRDAQHWKDFSKQGKMPPYFDLIEENVYLTERKKNKCHRDIKRMQCECPLLSKEERSQGEVACGEDCLNRLLMIECSSRCPNGDYCSNRRFQRKQHADVEAILTEKKGWGLRAGKDLKPNAFVLEYCGEVLDHKEFKARVKEYARNKNIHYYFMALKNDEIIDATLKGNCSRFMNHSCDPNCETQKWTVNGQLRVGFFTTRLVPKGAELTFDYQFQRYGREAQKCFCGSANCRGYLGGENRVSVRAAGGKMKKERSRKKDS
ncbi:PREDICTED: histone-lysine N-methyltransferase SETD2-like, partial [Nanorana parkeri]|uniref:histone-lysine N-methyltransferase SETD2-like n=1 Tax=Nanorana parkeri TaxID=125878 RepID=UPI0008544F04